MPALEDAASWAAASFTVLSVQGMARGASCLSQSKDGLLQLWDVATQKLCWEVATDSCSFARCLALPTAGGDPLDADPSSCLLCSPLSEPHVIGVFDSRCPASSPAAPSRRSELVLSGSAAEQRKRLGEPEGAASLGMCMSLCAVPALGPTHVLATYESTDTCVWDLRSPEKPLLASCLAGDPASPAICSAVLWRKAWVASAGGDISILRLRQDGIERTSAVRTAPTPYSQKSTQSEAGAWQSE
ncbi:unnamed protein product, partial [Polarella glacialis]